MPNPALASAIHRPIRVLLLASLALPVSALRAETPAGAPPQVTPSATADARDSIVDIRKTVEFLASPALEGRGSGTAGIDIASGFIAAKFQEIGLTPPPGWNSYFQPFNMTTSTTVDPATTLASGRGADWLKELGPKIELTKHYQPLSFSSEGKVDAPVVFVGYGITDSHFSYDDYAGVDVKGKVVLAMRFEPFDKEGNSAFTGKKDDYSENASIPTKAKLAADKGAVALILVNPPNWRSEDDITPFAKQSQFMRAGIPVIQVKQPVAEAMLTAGKLGKLEDLQRKIDEQTKPASVALAEVSVKAEVIFKRTEKQVRNVAAVLPGKGPKAGEYIVIGAHYDHLGRGGSGSLAPFSKDIHHGADDNASGTTAMLKLAEQLAASGPHERSLLFIGFTAEELGLIGSDHFVSNCPVPLASINGMLNLDMVGRIRDGNLQVGGSGTAASFEKILETAGKDSGLKLNTKSKGGMGPSDHMSFAKKKIPVLFFFSGLHTDYHRPTDTADKINYEGMEQVVALGVKVIKGMSAMEREQYVADFDSRGMSAMGSGSGSGSRGTKVTLGIIPDYSDDTIKGVRITGTTPGSPAEAAGLKDGDIIVAWDDTKLGNLMDIMGPLGKGKPDQKVKLKVLRDGKEIELEATLKERK